MTAIFTGTGAGFTQSSVSEVGASGTMGNASKGRAGEGVSVNAATGNLVISRQDEFLVGRGLDIGVSRTFNSLPDTHDGDNGDKWRMSTSRRIFDITGALNGAGSTLKRVSGDGSVVTYAWESRDGQWSYWATEGAGAHDRVYQQDADSLVWVDGTTQVTETYDLDPTNAGEYRIVKHADRGNQTVSFTYTGENLTSMQTSNGERIRYTWSGDQLTSIQSEFVHPATGVTVTQTAIYYTYDSGRLSTVTVDLSPESNGISDGDTYTIDYFYNSNGDVNRIRQKDGSRTDISYDAQGRVATITDFAGGSDDRITTFAYGSNYTDVTAPNGQITRLEYTAGAGQLTKVIAPPAYSGAARQEQTFTYDADGNLASTTNPQGQTTSFTYDAKGNNTLIDRPLGTDVVMAYDNTNQMIRETTVGSGVGTQAGETLHNYSRYTYDAAGLLRYSVSPEGHVTEYRYDSYRRLQYEVRYLVDSQPRNATVQDVAYMDAWRDDPARDKVQRAITRYYYDARGNLTRSVQYGTADANGNPTSANGAGLIDTHFVHDQEGRLLSRNSSTEGAEKFVYDGMGRVIASSDPTGSVTSVYFDDAATKTVIQTSAGNTRTMVYNKVGDLIVDKESSIGTTSTNQAGPLDTDWYSPNTTITSAPDVNGKPAFQLTSGTDGSISKGLGTLDAGETVRFRITLMAVGSQTTHRMGTYGTVDGWGASATSDAQAIIVDGPGTVRHEYGGLFRVENLSTTEPTTIEVVRTFSTSQYVGSYFYISEHNTPPAGTSVILSDPLLLRTIDDNAVDYNAPTNNEYDKLGRLRVSHDNFDNRGPSYIVYDNAGRRVGTVNPDGALTEYFYDDSNRVTGTATYTNPVSSYWLGVLADPNNTARIDQIRPALAVSGESGDVRSFTTYDANGRVAQTFNGQGEIISYEYDDSGRLVLERQHYTKRTVSTPWLTNPPSAPVSVTTHAEDAVTRTFYDRDGRVVGVLDGEGYLSETIYDEAGRAIRQARYINQTTLSNWLTASMVDIRADVTSGGARNTRMVYDGAGRLRFEMDAGRFVTQYNYNNAGKVKTTVQIAASIPTSVQDYSFESINSIIGTYKDSAVDRKTSTYYDNAGRVNRVSDAYGFSTYFTYDYAGNIVKTVAGDRTTRAWHDARGNVLFSVDAEGYISKFTYNNAGQVTSERRYSARVTPDNNGNATIDDNTTLAEVAALAVGGFSRVRSEYDAAGRVIAEYDQNNVRTRYTYHADGRLYQTEQAYDRSDDATDTADHNITTWVYDKAGRVITEERATGEAEVSKMTYYYNGLGDRVEVKDALNRRTYFTYDSRGQLETETNPENEQVRYEYNAFGELVKTWDAKNVLASESAYDNRGLLTDSWDALGNHTRYTYNGFGEVETVRDARNALTRFTYDRLGRVLTSEDALGYVESYRYDSFSNRTRVTNKLGGRVDYEFDRLGRVVNMNDALGYDTAYEYDARGNVTKMQQEVVLNSDISTWHTTTNTYDDADQLTSMTTNMFAGNVTETYTYDNRGNMTSKTAADGGKTVYYYDDLDRVTLEINAAGTYTKYVYDRLGNVTDIRVYDLDTLPRPSDGGAQEEAPVPSGGSRHTKFYYDTANRLIESQVRNITTYELSGQNLAVNPSTTLSTFYEYDENGNVIVTTDPNGAMSSDPNDGKTFVYYDALNRKIGQVDADKFVTEWEYDAVGNVSREIRYAEALEGTVSANTFLRPDTSNDDRITEYTYDLMGNRTSETRLNVKHYDGASGYVTSNGTSVEHPKVTYEYNGLGQVTKKTEAVAGNVTDYQYDNAGRLTKETRAAFADFDNVLLSPEVTYAYDGLGNLTKTRQQGYGATATRETLYSYRGGKLEWTLDAQGNYRYYGYDAAGRENEVYYTRTDYWGNTRTEGVSRTYDQMGRVVSEFQGTRANNGTWTAVSPVTTTTYTAHGQVATVQLNSGDEIKNTYDRAGRLIKTNAEDGIYKLFGYDANGNQTGAITSAGYNMSGKSFANALPLVEAGQSDMNITYTVYNGRNLATRIEEPDRDLSTTATGVRLRTEREYNAFGEVKWEKNANDAQVDYEYNTLGKVITVTNPQVDIHLENGQFLYNTAPIERYFHDEAGRLVAQQDANGNFTRMELLNGTGFGDSEALVTKVTYADGGQKQTKYDRHGDARRIISVADGRSELNRTIEQTFDKLGRVTQTYHRGSGLEDNYTYDVNGQQTSHWNNLYGSGNREIMDYDAMGRVIYSRAFGGDETITTYTWVQDGNTNAVDNFGGFKEEVSVTGISNNAIEWSDIFGRVKKREDFGGNVYTNIYDNAGRMTRTSKGSSQVNYTYYDTGKLKQSILTDPNVTNSPQVDTTYGYDRAGNLTRQKTLHKGYVVTQDMTATYDALGRLKTWSEVGNNYVLPAASTNYTYDANGNIRSITGSHYRMLSDQTVASSSTSHDYYYLYDSMNRVVRSKGELVANQIVRGDDGVDIAYNDAGQRISTTTSRRTQFNYYIYSGRSGGVYATGYYDADVSEQYTYDDAGQLQQVSVATSQIDVNAFEAAVYQNPNADPNDYVSGPGVAVKRAEYEYDILGRVTLQEDFESNGTTVAYSRDVTYSTNDGFITREVANSRKDGDVYTADTRNYYNADNTLNYSTTTNTKTGGGSSPPNTRTDYDYVYFDSAVQDEVTYDNDTSQSDPTYVSVFAYNSFGHLIASGIYDGQQRDVFFDNTVDGQVIKRKETLRSGSNVDKAPLQLYYRFGGKEMGTVGNDGTANVTYEQSIIERQMDTSNNFGPFRNGATNGVGYADFGGDYEALNSYQQGSTGGMYTVRGGESLQAIASQLWGDSSLWYKIAEANGLSGREPLAEGRNLVIPTGVQRTHHNASTYKPYDPAEAIGDLSPTSPAEPNNKKNKCGVFGAVLVAVVAIAVTVVTSGAALSAAGLVSGGVFGATGGVAAVVSGGLLSAAGSFGAAVAIGAGAAVVGSVVSQGLAVATGIQEKFNWKGVGLAAISGGFSGGLGQSFGAGIVGAVARGAVTSAATQWIGREVGLQDKFSWAGVAAAGAGAGLGSYVGGELGSSFGARLVSNTAGAVANAATRSAIEGSSFGKAFEAVLPDAIAQALSSVVTDGLTREGSRVLEIQRTAERAQRMAIVAEQAALAAENANAAAGTAGAAGSSNEAQGAIGVTGASPSAQQTSSSQNNIVVTGKKATTNPTLQDLINRTNQWLSKEDRKLVRNNNLSELLLIKIPKARDALNEAKSKGKSDKVIDKRKSELFELNMIAYRVQRIMDNVMIGLDGQSYTVKLSDGSEDVRVLRTPHHGFSDPQLAAESGIVMGRLHEMIFGDGMERGGWVTQNTDGTYSYSIVVGSEGGSIWKYDKKWDHMALKHEKGKPFVPISIGSPPKGAVAHWHTHPYKSKSPADKDFSNNPKGAGDIQAFERYEKLYQKRQSDSNPKNDVPDLRFYLGGSDFSFDSYHFDRSTGKPVKDNGYKGYFKRK